MRALWLGFVVLVQAPALAVGQRTSSEDERTACVAALFEAGTFDSRPKWTRRGFFALGAGIAASATGITFVGGKALYEEYYPGPVVQLSTWDQRSNGSEVDRWSKRGARLYFVSLPSDVPLGEGDYAQAGIRFGKPTIALGSPPVLHGLFSAHQAIPLEIAERVAQLEEGGPALTALAASRQSKPLEGLFSPSGKTAANAASRNGFSATPFSTSLGMFLMNPERDVYPMRWSRPELFSEKIRARAATIAEREPYRYNANVLKLLQFVTEAAAHQAPADRDKVQALFQRYYAPGGLSINHGGVRSMYTLLLQSWWESQERQSTWDAQYTERILRTLQGSYANERSDERIAKELRAILSEALVETVEPVAEVTLFEGVPVYFAVPNGSDEALTAMLRRRFRTHLPPARQ